MFSDGVGATRRKRVLVYGIRPPAEEDEKQLAGDRQTQSENRISHALGDDFLWTRQGRRVHGICHYLAGDLFYEPSGGVETWRAGATKIGGDAAAGEAGGAAFTRDLQIQVTELVGGCGVKHVPLLS